MWTRGLNGPLPASPGVSISGLRRGVVRGLGRIGGGVAQLGERVLCKHEVVGSIPSASTMNLVGGKGGSKTFGRGFHPFEIC